MVLMMDPEMMLDETIDLMIVGHFVFWQAQALAVAWL
jgi:hypothetical protein